MSCNKRILGAVLVCLSITACAGEAKVAKDNPAAKELANKNGCMSCHDIGTKIIGPSFVQIAEKYQGQADASAVLVKKVKEGGKGVWGRIPMPANENVPEKDLSTMVGWILAQ